MSLNKPAITELTTESAPLNLLNEWLCRWFDGNAHAVGTNDPVTFPKVNRAFGQGPVVQPLFNLGAGIDAEIRVVMLPRKEVQESLDTSLFSGKLVTSSVVLNFWISAKHPGKDGSASEQSAQRIGELLKAILTNPAARYELCEKGFRAFQPSEPQPLPNADYAKRLVVCAVQLQYPVQFGDAVFPADELSLAFTNEDPLLAGNYLLGQFVWQTRPVQLLSVNASYWPSQTQDVVLGLEVGGGLTGFTLTLLQGVANTDALVASVPVNLIVGPTQLVRWVVLSAPVPALSAWHVTVNVVAK